MRFCVIFIYDKQFQPDKPFPGVCCSTCWPDEWLPVEPNKHTEQLSHTLKRSNQAKVKTALNYFNNLYGSASTAAVCMCVAQYIIFFTQAPLANRGVFNGKNNGSATFRSQRVHVLILYLLADSTPLHGTLMQFINVNLQPVSCWYGWERIYYPVIRCSNYRAHFSMLWKQRLTR